jgi:hypothetical protein
VPNAHWTADVPRLPACQRFGPEQGSKSASRELGTNRRFDSRAPSQGNQAILDDVGPRGQSYFGRSDRSAQCLVHGNCLCSAAHLSSRAKCRPAKAGLRGRHPTTIRRHAPRPNHPHRRNRAGPAPGSWHPGSARPGRISGCPSNCGRWDPDEIMYVSSKVLADSHGTELRTGCLRVLTFG